MSELRSKQLIDAFIEAIKNKNVSNKKDNKIFAMSNNGNKLYIERTDITNITGLHLGDKPIYKIGIEDSEAYNITVDIYHELEALYYCNDKV